MNDFDRLFAISGLSLDRLRTFLEVAEAGSMSKAAKGDPTRQSQFSRQVKELEGFFGIALTRRVGRRIEITEEGNQLARTIRRHFLELDDFREAMSGRSVSVRIGASSSVLDWLVLPKLAGCRAALGEVVLELEHSRTLEAARSVADGRLDFAIIRQDAAPAGVEIRPLGSIGYALFAPIAAWRDGKGVEEIFSAHPFAELLPGGQFSRTCAEFLAAKGWNPRVVARTGSFQQLARLVRAEGLAAVLPTIAGGEFDPAKIHSEALPWDHERPLALLANARSLARAGIRPGAVDALAMELSWTNDRS